MKKAVSIILTLIITVSFIISCSAQEDTDITDNTEIILSINQPYILINGAEHAIDTEGTVPVLIDDRTLLPVRAVVEAMGGTVEWDGDTQTVTLTKNMDTIRLVIDSDTAYLNDVPKTLDVAPRLISDRTMLPIRFIAENFQYQVEWDEANQRVILTQEVQETAEPVTPSEDSDPLLETEPVNEPEKKQEQPVLTNENQITVTINGQSFTATLEDNETAEAFYAMLPLTLEMNELNGNEKYYYLDESLPKNNRQIGQIQTGDLMLYGSNCIVSFFKTFTTSYTYTPIGHIDDAEGYAAALPSGSVTVTFTK